MTRHMHFVGSLPPELTSGDDAVMRWFHDHAYGHQLTALPTSQDPDWVVSYLRNLADTPALERTHPGGYTGYRDLAGYRVRRGGTLLPEHVAPAVEAVTLQQVSRFRRFRDQHHLSATPLLLGVPHPVDLALFTFVGPSFTRAVPNPVQVRRALHHLPVFTRAVADYITHLHHRSGAALMWQLEMPSALVAMHKASRTPGGPAAASWAHASHTAALLARIPATAQVMLHLCYGDLGHREVFQPTDLSWPVGYLNRLARALHSRHVPPPHTVHLPAAAGAHPPPVESRFYAPLGRLDRVWQLTAGVAHPDDVDVSRRALLAFEVAADRQAVAVATACGLGRVDVDTATRAAKVMATIA